MLIETERRIRCSANRSEASPPLGEGAEPEPPLVRNEIFTSGLHHCVVKLLPSAEIPVADRHHPSNFDRVPRRTRVLMTATLLTPDGAQKVRVRDLSSHGARVLTEWPISDGCDALFKRGQVFVAASIVWSSRAEAGISFYRQISSVELEAAFNGAESVESAGDHRGRYPKKGVAIIGDAAPAS